MILISALFVCLWFFNQFGKDKKGANRTKPGGCLALDGGLTFGIAICADIGNPAVFAACRRQGARIIFELAAPGLYGEQATRSWQSGYAWWEGECLAHCGKYARELGCWIAVATQAGRTVDEDFPGGGYLFAPGGEQVFATQYWSAGEAYLEVDLEGGTVGRA